VILNSHYKSCFGPMAAAAVARDDAEMSDVAHSPVARYDHVENNDWGEDVTD
jgi:hypothetical protein